MFFPLHWTILFNLFGIELYKVWMYSKGILSNSSWQNAQSSSIFLEYLWKTLFFSRLQTFLIILLSGEFPDQFLRTSNPFSENQVVERIELFAGALSCCNFSPKNISGNRLFSQNLEIFDRIYRSTDFLKTFPTIVGNETTKHQFFSAKSLGFRWILLFHSGIG